MVEESRNDDIDGVPARARKAGITLIVWAAVALALVPVVLLRPTLDATAPMIVGYLSASITAGANAPAGERPLS